MVEVGTNENNISDFVCDICIPCFLCVLRIGMVDWCCNAAADTTPIPKSVPSPRNSRTEEDVWSALRDIDFKPKLMDRYISLLRRGRKSLLTLIALVSLTVFRTLSSLLDFYLVS